MKNYGKILLLIAALLFCSGCATIIKGTGPQGVNFKSEPSEAKVTIIDLANGNVMANTKTPQVVMLPKSSGYFKAGKYNVTFEKEGFDKKDFTLESNVTAWYIGGNFLFGGLIGWILVDPASGAMWHFDPDQVSVLLNPRGIDPLGFSAEEFKTPLTIDALCAAINVDNYAVDFKQPDNSLNRLNEFLERPDLYEKLSAKNKFPLKGGEIVLPPDINDLKNQTNTYRDGEVSFFSLNFDQQTKLKKFNRRLVEIAYPTQTPKK